MRIQEWIFLFIVASCGIALANFVGFQVGLIESLPGIGILFVLSLCGVVISKVLPIRLPIVAYCSLLGLLAASPLSFCREFVITSVNQINFTAPLTMVGAFAGISISDQLKEFAAQGWKMIIIGLLVMTGTFLGSAVVSQIMLSITGAI